jgi:HEPN domain-containing protein
MIEYNEEIAKEKVGTAKKIFELLEKVYDAMLEKEDG